MLMVALPFMAIVFVALAMMVVNDARRARKERREGFGPLSDDEASTLPEQIVEPEDLRPAPDSTTTSPDPRPRLKCQSRTGVGAHGRRRMWGGPVRHDSGH